MKLSALIEGIPVTEVTGIRDIEPAGISTDSRSIRQGEIFAAIQGSAADGHDFINEAVERGASALIVGRAVASDLPVIRVENTAAAAALVAKRFFGDPAADMTLVGITGTNGKTSTSFLVQAILRRAIGPTGIIGTVGFGEADTLRAAANTTPSSVELYRIIAHFKERGCRAVVMEVSSHAAVQDRVTGLEFDVGVFTNVTRDHLDYHSTFERYVAAKERFVATLVEPGRRKGAGTLVYNADDRTVVGVAGRFAGETVSFGFGKRAQVRAHRLRADLQETRFELEDAGRKVRVRLKLLGTFNACNALAAAAAARSLGVGIDVIREGLEDVRAIPGRFEVISTGRGPTVIVDYAHTPDALEGLLHFCRELSPARIVTVFGCGGDRDRGKRPLMGRIACNLSDTVYVTDDNPRTENPDVIIDEVLAGMQGSEKPVAVIRDREEAIRRAVGEADEGDLVVIAGKGHETVQILKDSTVPFSDARQARLALEASEVRHQG